MCNEKFKDLLLATFRYAIEYYYSVAHYISMTYLFYNWKFCLLTPFTYFVYSNPTSGNINLFSLAVSLVFGFVSNVPHVSKIVQQLSLTYCTQDKALKIHPCCYEWEDFLLFYGQIIFHVCVYHIACVLFFFFSFFFFLIFICSGFCHTLK